MSDYAELQVTSNFSFLRGASHPKELFERAAELGIAALAITDRNSLAGIIRAYAAAKETGLRLIVGCHLDLQDGSQILVYPTDKPAYSRLCRLLSIGKKRGGKGACILYWDDIASYKDGMIAIMLAHDDMARAEEDARRVRYEFGQMAYLGLSVRRHPKDAARLKALSAIAQRQKIPTVALGDVRFHISDRRFLYDVMNCIREKCTIDGAGYKRDRWADRYMKSPEETAHLFRKYPEALKRSLDIANKCTFSLAELEYQYPAEANIPGLSPQQGLERYTWEGAKRRYPEGVPEKISKQITHELGLIASLNYAPYFLTVYSIVNFARFKGILCQGRGSAANSAVCFALGITSIDPNRLDLLFERFISMERNEPPDIDVDFEHERREEVIQWIYETYGRTRSALTAVVSRYRTKGAIRDVGKVLGLPEDVIEILSHYVTGNGHELIQEKHAKHAKLNLNEQRLRYALGLAQELVGFPRHLSQHPGGFVLTNDRLDDLVPIEPARMEDRQVIEWDKDDIDVLKFMKVDILGLGMLGCIRNNFELLSEYKDIHLELATIPAEDPETYNMICKADTVGTFQIESRAQMTMLPRLKPRTFYDLVVEVSLVRPGPIQGGMVHPYLRRRDGTDPVTYPTPELESVLKKTLGVPLFQEQVMNISIICAGFTPSEADELRRAMATFKMTGGVSKFKQKLLTGMLARGYTLEFAQTCIMQIEGFGSYGFPESHAASFALLAYASSWLKCHHPDVFCCAILNAYPMGFYAPAQLVRDARLHGVTVKAVDVNCSRWDCTLEACPGKYLAVRLGFRMIKGISNDEMAQLIAVRGEQPFDSVEELRARAGVSASSLEHLADADAFGSIAVNRRDALWDAKGQIAERLPLFAAAEKRERMIYAESVEPAVALASMSDAMEVTEDYAFTGLTLRQHPIGFLRSELRKRNVIEARQLSSVRNGQIVDIAGIVLVRQRPGTASGVIFITMEDETGFANLIIWPSLRDAQREEVISTKLLICRGKVQREGLVIHVVAHRLTAIDQFLPKDVCPDHIPSDARHIIDNLGTRSRDFH